MFNFGNIFSRFGKVSGKQLNLQKSFVKFSPPMMGRLKVKLIEFLAMTQVENIGTHLGVPIDLMGKKSSIFQPLVHAVDRKIGS